jgi:membrane associated rhomboid family serine protease
MGLVVAVIWGSALLSGVLPHEHISWQGHLSGGVGGILAASLLARPRARAAGTLPA